mmetsp:Transcript_92929/g.266368  ORF Transcript_92929/g.266368 Transcript_92929/m.266368 type:complete len:184 (+) Transcript_92929:124-675(+)
MGAVHDRCCEQTGSTPSSKTPTQVVYQTGGIDAAPSLGEAAPVSHVGQGSTWDEHGTQKWDDDWGEEAYGDADHAYFDSNVEAAHQADANPLQMLDGVWFNSERQMMGAILDGVISWDVQFNHPETPLHLLQGGGISMDLAGATHYGELLETTWPVRLHWSDGDIWTRQSDPNEAYTGHDGVM